MPYMLDTIPPKFRNRPILFIDLEMSGLDAGRHEILEIAALVVNQPEFQIVNSYYTKIIPEHIDTADPRALKLLSFSSSDWSEAIPLPQALTELSQLAPQCILAGWCVQNEWDFLLAALAKYKLPIFFSHHLLEVWTLAFYKLYSRPELSYLNIASTSRHLGIHLDHHKPDSDIRATYEIFKKLIKNPA